MADSRFWIDDGTALYWKWDDETLWVISSRKKQTSMSSVDVMDHLVKGKSCNHREVDTEAECRKHCGMEPLEAEPEVEHFRSPGWVVREDCPLRRGTFALASDNHYKTEGEKVMRCTRGTWWDSGFTPDEIRAHCHRCSSAEEAERPYEQLVNDTEPETEWWHNPDASTDFSAYRVIGERLEYFDGSCWNDAMYTAKYVRRSCTRVSSEYEAIHGVPEAAEWPKYYLRDESSPRGHKGKSWAEMCAYLGQLDAKWLIYRHSHDGTKEMYWSTGSAWGAAGGNLDSPALRRITASEAKTLIDGKVAEPVEEEKPEPPAVPKFEIGQYVRSPSEKGVYLVVDEAAYKALGRDHVPHGAKWFHQWPDGRVTWSHTYENYSLWQPAVGERVWVEGNSIYCSTLFANRLCDVRKIYDDGDIVVHDKESGEAQNSIYHPCNIHPASFAPKEEEKPAETAVNDVEVPADVAGSQGGGEWYVSPNTKQLVLIQDDKRHICFLHKSPALWKAGNWGHTDWRKLTEPEAIELMAKHDMPWPDSMGPKCWTNSLTSQYYRRGAGDSIEVVFANGEAPKIRTGHDDGFLKGICGNPITEPVARAHCNMDKEDTKAKDTASQDVWPVGTRVLNKDAGVSRHNSGVITKLVALDNNEMSYEVQCDDCAGYHGWLHDNLERIDEKAGDEMAAETAGPRCWIDEDDYWYYREIASLPGHVEQVSKRRGVRIAGYSKVRSLSRYREVTEAEARKHCGMTPLGPKCYYQKGHDYYWRRIDKDMIEVVWPNYVGNTYLHSHEEMMERPTMCCCTESEAKTKCGMKPPLTPEQGKERVMTNEEKMAVAIPFTIHPRCPKCGHKHKGRGKWCEELQLFDRGCCKCSARFYILPRDYAAPPTPPTAAELEGITMLKPHRLTAQDAATRIVADARGNPTLALRYRALDGLLSLAWWATKYVVFGIPVLAIRRVKARIGKSAGLIVDTATIAGTIWGVITYGPGVYDAVAPWVADTYGYIANSPFGDALKAVFG